MEASQVDLNVLVELIRTPRMTSVVGSTRSNVGTLRFFHHSVRFNHPVGSSMQLPVLLRSWGELNRMLPIRKHSFLASHCAGRAPPVAFDSI